MYRRLIFAVLVTFIVAVPLAGCAAPAQGQAQAAAGANKTMPLAPASVLPKEVQAAPARVRAAYQFAVANPDALRNVPCYCGCGAMGHTSDLSCYVKEFKPDGTVAAYADHALGCSLCVDIATDVMRMSNEGRAPAQIRSDIIAAYSKFGPPNQATD